MSSETPALSFGGVAADYDRLRPSPAPDALSWLIPDPCEHAVDLAAGTGLFTRALAGRVPQVIAVEPDERMREVFALRSPDIEIRAGRGESIPLADAEFSYSRPTSKADIVATLATYSPVIALDDDTRARALGLAATRLEERFPDQDPVDVTITTHAIRVDRAKR